MNSPIKQNSLLMAVFGQIETDGRVLRSIQAQFNLRMLTTKQVLFDKTFEKFPFGMILSSDTSKKELDLFLSENINSDIFKDFREKNSKYNWDGKAIV